jgi:hypothetical protein
VPVPPNAIGHPLPVTTLLAPASPLPSAPEHRHSYRPQTGDANAAHANTFFQSASVEIRGVIGQSATVGGNAAHIAAPGIHEFAGQAGQYNQQAALEAIANHGNKLDTRA